MFILSEKNIGVSLADINKIIITYFSIKTDVIDIFDNNYEFNENLIPMITSILGIAPKISNYKEYKCIDNNIIIHRKNNSLQQYQSFYLDVNNLENNHILDVRKMDLISTLVDIDDKQLIRLYNVKDITTQDAPINTNTNTNIYTTDFTQNILNEKEHKKISWEFEWGSIDIVINVITKKCKYEIIIDIIEDTKFIHSRLTHINEILQKFNKIKSEFILN
jgi:hypothetical protein